MFIFQNYDIPLLSALVLLSNLWVAWKQLDTDEYSWATCYKEPTDKNLHSQGSS